MPTLKTSLLSLALLLAGCDMLGIEAASAVAARREAEGKAVGGGCRHAGRAIEDCYALNKKAEKAAVFAGWREMNDYMRENKIEAVAPQAHDDEDAHPKKEAKAEAAPVAEAGDKADKTAKPAKKKS
jgi:hypothetical protein